MMSFHVRDRHGLTQFWKLHRRSSVMTLLESEDGIVPIDMCFEHMWTFVYLVQSWSKSKSRSPFPMTW